MVKEIVIESLRYGKFVDSHHSKFAKITGCRDDQLPNTEWVKWKMWEGSGYVCFESVRYPNHYLDIHHSKSEGNRHNMKITHSNGLPGDWGKFKIVGDLSNCYIQSLRWKDRYLDAHHSGKLLATQGNPSEKWARFSIRSPGIVSYKWVVIYENTNMNEHKSNIKYRLKSCEEKEYETFKSSGWNLTLSADAEKTIKGAKCSASAGFGYTNSNHSRMSEYSYMEREHEESTTIEPKTMLRIEQLVTRYGGMDFPMMVTRSSIKKQ